MTTRERAVIRAIIRALRGEGVYDVDTFALAYGLPHNFSKPIRNAAADLLEAMANDNS